MNLCFVIVLITILALQHSASVFAPAESRYDPVSYVPYQGYLRAESGRLRSGDRSGNRLTTALDYLSDLWRRSMIIKQWMLEYETTYLERLRTARGTESDLVEARFHVANAEVFGAAMGEQQRAKIEIGRADLDVQKALPLVAVNMMPALEAIRKELADTKMELEMAAPNTETSDEQIKADLDRAIASLHGKRL